MCKSLAGLVISFFIGKGQLYNLMSSQMKCNKPYRKGLLDSNIGSNPWQYIWSAYFILNITYNIIIVSPSDCSLVYLSSGNPVIN